VRLYHWESPEGNVGDDLNLWMWPRLLGDVFDDASDTVFVGIGSVLDDRHAGAARRIVFGPGARSAASAPDIRAPGWDVRFVRGPRTAAALGLGEDRWISDPAILAPLVHGPRPGSGPGTATRTGFIPYFRTRLAYAAALADMAGLSLVPTTLDPGTFLRRLLACDHVVVEAMHGAILADAFGIPWMPCRISNLKFEGATHGFKWSDWLEGLALDPAFLTLPYVARRLGGGLPGQLALLGSAWRAASILRGAIAAGRWTLSDRALLARRQEAMMAEIDRLKREIAGGA
jgi:succinoglycan biosynthesis protein ExoV